MFRRLTSAFNLVELISAIAIMAVLALMVVVVIPYVVAWAQQVSDQKTLLVLNDALTRYKCEGGNVSSLTLGVSVGRVISYLQSTITWAGQGHHVMQQGRTYPARSLSVTKSGAQYHFTRFNSYTAEPGVTDPNINTSAGGLVGWWKFDEGSGASLADSSGSGNTATVYNSPTWVVGHNGIGHALSFTATNQYAGFPPSLGPTAFTFSFWINPISVNSSIWPQYNLLFASESYGTNGFRCGIKALAGMTFDFWSAESGGTVDVTGSTAIPIGTWSCVTVTYDGATAKVFVNGSLCGSATGTILQHGLVYLRAGAGGTTAINGIFDDIRIYSRALNASEVSRLYSE